MQRLRVATFAVLVGMPTLALASTTGLRNVFLNGIDISSAKSQDLKHVDVHISESGDIFLVAPHYQVNEEDSFVPLSRYVQGLSQPTHQPAQKMESTVQAQPGPGAPVANPMSTTAAATPADSSGAPDSAVTPESTPTSDMTPPPKTGLLPKAGSPIAPNGAGKPGALAAGAPSAVPASPPPSSADGQDVGNESAAGPIGDSAATPK